MMAISTTKFTRYAKKEIKPEIKNFAIFGNVRNWSIKTALKLVKAERIKIAPKKGRYCLNFEVYVSQERRIISAIFNIELSINFNTIYYIIFETIAQIFSWIWSMERSSPSSSHFIRTQLFISETRRRDCS